MLPSSSSSPRGALVNRTNIFTISDDTPTRPKSFFPLPTPPKHEKVKRPSTTIDGRVKKRVKLCLDRDELDGASTTDESDSDEERDAAVIRARARKGTVFHMRNVAMDWPIRRSRHPNFSSRPILQSFVSSHKSDVFKCQSTELGYALTPPYACSYTHGAKAGGIPLLAVATEQGSVHIFNTSKRNDWDFEPPRTSFQPHTNGIFDIRWNPSDTLLATSSGDQSTRISCPATTTVLHALRGHTSTVKCVAWDPNHENLLSTGGRDGAICIWDLRVGEGRSTREDGANTLSPVTTITGAHEEAISKGNPKPRGRKGKAAPVAKSVTSLVYADTDPYGLISSGSFDGILKFWDLRAPTPSKKSSRSPKPKSLTPLYTSPFDPTTIHGSRRPRGITSLTPGIGPSAGLLFALGADSRVHTYSLPYMTAQPGGYTHENMQTNSFYVRLASSPCGRWLASGGTGPNGSVFLYDVSNAARQSRSSPVNASLGVELRGQVGDVGAIDWADGMLATCADDGTVRVWRPDVDVYRSCLEQPEEKRWEWSWSIGK